MVIAEAYWKSKVIGMGRKQSVLPIPTLFSWQFSTELVNLGDAQVPMRANNLSYQDPGAIAILSVALYRRTWGFNSR
ncbi:hypothetical protein AXFE_35320 [Acidithrix ferrooxidans]|uniref:Uncharacterized protein n=2 Tax=Acidithrix ferrooxidans TaxID=1280514 RepID=A0A0D8HCL4_9ACTN|nr:hypothetical protein AXFE_35320 [Acidithrix ferrooxidans]